MFPVDPQAADEARLEMAHAMDVWQELMVTQMVNERLAAEVATLRAEVAAFRKAIVEGDGPSCEDVCLRSCIGVCEAATIADLAEDE